MFLFWASWEQISWRHVLCMITKGKNVFFCIVTEVLMNGMYVSSFSPNHSFYGWSSWIKATAFVLHGDDNHFFLVLTLTSAIHSLVLQQLQQGNSCIILVWRTHGKHNQDDSLIGDSAVIPILFPCLTLDMYRDLCCLESLCSVDSLGVGQCLGGHFVT